MDPREEFGKRGGGGQHRCTVKVVGGGLPRGQGGGRVGMA